MTMREIADDLINYAKCDEIALVELEGRIRMGFYPEDTGYFAQADDPDEYEVSRRLTLDLARLILDSGEVRACHYHGKYPDAVRYFWETSTEESVARIEREWKAMDRGITFGDIVYFFHKDYPQRPDYPIG